MLKKLTLIKKYLLFSGIVLLPILVVSVFVNPFDPPKLGLLTLVVGLGVLITLVEFAINGKISVNLGKADLWVLFLALAYLASALLKSGNKMEAFFLPGTATVVLASALLYFLLNQAVADKKELLAVLSLSALAAAIASLLAQTQIFAKISPLPAFAKNPNFVTIGAGLPHSIFLLTVLPLPAYLFWLQKDLYQKIFWGLASLLIAASLGLTVFNLLPGKAAAVSLPSFKTSWVVAVDSLKESPVVGVGPGNYLTAFSRFKPLDFNATPFWTLRFATAASFVLTLLTETGLLGLIVFGLLLFAIFSKTDRNPLTIAPLALSSLLLFVLPANLPVLVLFFSLLSLNASPRPLTIEPSLQTNLEALPKKSLLALILLPLFAGVLVFGYFAGRALFAEYRFRQALNALSQNQAQETYAGLRETIGLNPYVDRYHAAASQIDLAIARSLTQRPELTDADRNTVAQLIQEAISEGKATVVLNRQRAANWEVLAKTYQAIMPFASGADNFAVQTYSQAVAFDPLNPNLRIALGGIYYALGRFDEAIRSFELAVLAKPDLANGHYNLAVALREKGEIQKAIDQMNVVLSLVAKDSPDYELARNELDSLQKKLPPQETQGTANLTPPQPAEAPVIKPPLELPSEANPPGKID